MKTHKFDSPQRSRGPTLGPKMNSPSSKLTEWRGSKVSTLTPFLGVKKKCRGKIKKTPGRSRHPQRTEQFKKKSINAFSSNTRFKILAGLRPNVLNRTNGLKRSSDSTLRLSVETP